MSDDVTRPPVILTVDGRDIYGFESGSLQLSMQEGCNVFDVSYVPDTDTPDERLVFEGDAVTLSLDNGTEYEQVLEGFVDGVEENDEESAFTLSVNGRSATGDLIDCSATPKQRSWDGVYLAQIIQDLCDPHDISSIIVGDQGDTLRFSIRLGETSFEAISRAAMLRGFYPYCVSGELVLARAGAGQTATVLERGKNVRRWTRSSSWYSRFSDYLIRGQGKSDDDSDHELPKGLNAAVRDEQITRYRPLIIQSETDLHTGKRTKNHLEFRAELERNQRAGRGENVLITADGWTNGEGLIWRPNTLVRAKNPRLGIDATLLVASVRFRFGADEPRDAELLCMRPVAFDIEDYPAIRRGESWT